MAVTIRLSRAGKKRDLRFTVIAIQKAERRDGAFIERLGYYNPKAVEPKDKITIDIESYKSWRAKGAQISETVARLVRAAGIDR